MKFTHKKLRCPKCKREGHHELPKGTGEYLYCRCVCGQRLRVKAADVESGEDLFGRINGTLDECLRTIRGARRT